MSYRSSFSLSRNHTFCKLLPALALFQCVLTKRGGVAYTKGVICHHLAWANNNYFIPSLYTLCFLIFAILSSEIEKSAGYSLKFQCQDISGPNLIFKPSRECLKIQISTLQWEGEIYFLQEEEKYIFVRGGKIYSSRRRKNILGGGGDIYSCRRRRRGNIFLEEEAK